MVAGSVIAYRLNPGRPRMHDAQGHIDDQLAQVERMLLRNTTLEAVLNHAHGLDLPGWYLTAGAVFQTVWNCVTGRDPEQGIRDYDLIYFDRSDLSWEAEDAVIRRARRVRNQARVHLWYEQKFGRPWPPHPSSEAAIDSFAATTCCVGVRLDESMRMRVYAPHGFADLFSLVLRPNPVLAPRAVYDAKAARWGEEWRELHVLPWPARE
jgi:uncharacterized protein